MEKNCNDCTSFYTCDNTGTYEECLPTYEHFLPDLEGIDLKTCDAEMACLVSECKYISEAEVEALLTREDVDRDYGDMYFFAMLPYQTIRVALEYNRNTD